MSENIEQPKNENNIDKNRRYCELEEELIVLFIKQISHELYNKALYLTFANYFAIEGLPKLEQYYKERAEEEEKHHHWIYEWLSYNDVQFEYPNVEAINIDIKDRIHPFKLTVDVEIETTDLIDKIMNAAIELKDYRTIAWLNGCGPIEGKLIPEQAEELSISRTIRDMAEEEYTSWQDKQRAILDFYHS